MQPGGRREPDESDLASLSREIREELGCSIVPGTAKKLGIFEAPAANEPGQWVQAAIYAVSLVGDIATQAEIEELAWVDPRQTGELQLAPLTRDTVLPLALSLNDNTQAL